MHSKTVQILMIIASIFAIVASLFAIYESLHNTSLIKVKLNKHIQEENERWQELIQRQSSK